MSWEGYRLDATPIKSYDDLDRRRSPLGTTVGR